MKDKVSIITTFYNSEKYILQCIHSVNSQLTNDEFNIEYIIVDDCSEDSTHEMIDTFFKEYGERGSCEYKIIKTPQNLGCGGARNFGISNSTGNYIMFLDADDYYMYNNFVLRAYNMIKKYNADIVEFGIKYVNQNGERINAVSKEILISDNHLNNISLMFYDNLIKFMPWTKILKRSIVETRSYDTSRTFEDIRATPYWVYNANKIVIANTIEINYRAVQGSIIRENPNDTRLGTVTAIASLFEDFKTNKDILKIMYDRCLADLRTMLMVDSNSDYFKEMSKLNTYI